MSSPCTVGIAVGKGVLEVAARPGGATIRFAGGDAGHRELLVYLQSLEPDLIVVGAAEGWETVAIVATLALAGLPLAVVSAARLPALARAAGLGPAGRPGAAGLAHYGQERRPTAHRLPAEALEGVTAQAQRLHEIAEMIALEEQNLLSIAAKAARGGILAHLGYLRGERAALEEGISRLIRQSPLWQEEAGQDLEEGEA